MKRQIIGILVCSLLITTAFLLAAGTVNTGLVDRNNPAHPTDRGPEDSHDVNIHRGFTLSSRGSDNANIHRVFTLSSRDSKNENIYRYANTGSKDGIIWDNGMHYSNMGASQDDNILGLDPILADDFTFEEQQEVGDVHWIGGYWNPIQDGNFDWEIKFYNDFGDGTKPGATIATYSFSNAQVNETPIDTLGDAYYCDYFVYLPAPLSFSPGIKYWISIQGIGNTPPQSGWAMHTSILLHEAVFKSEYFGYPDWTNSSDPFGIAYDMCFQLTEEEEPWPNHKMHFPQLPDLEGWDVNATYPKILADDWQCSRSGPIEDIHFWGSWKDLDGAPWTDDFPPWPPYFWLSIHRNIPADIDTPWSRPGELLWGWEGEIPGIPYEPPAMEHWFDPNTGEYFCNDHIPYWRYDFFFDQAYPPPDSFYQDKDSIYWLNITYFPYEPEPPCQWGWKSSRDHFMDDAVYTDEDPFGPWYPMFEPPRCNWFDVYFDSLGYPHDMESTNYYGSGWYKYEYWWNMWFYDNPFTYERPKYIYLQFYISEVGPQPFYQFAINWSTDAWYYEGEPGRPPLPGEDEEFYIGRQVFEVYPGWNYIDYEIWYNPEWVSIDFVAQDVIINGWIWHECYQTSMDLAFVITGVEEEEEFIRGDYDGDGDNKEMSDYLSALAWIFKQPGYVNPQCLDAVDYDNDGNALEMSDQLSGLSWAFAQPGSVPPAGYLGPGICYSDPPLPADALDCQCHPYCMGCKGIAKIQASPHSVQGSPNRLIVGEAGVSQDGYATVPVFLTNDQALSGFEYTVTYDTELLTVEDVDNKGLTTEGYDFFVSDIDDQAGKVRVGNIPSFRFERDLPVGSRQVANIVFKLDVGRLSQDVLLGLENVDLLDAGVHSLSAEWVSGVVKAGVPDLPKEFALAQNYPNPFNSTTLIKYVLPVDCQVRLDVYNVVGQRVATLVDGQQKAGYRSATWNAKDLASGVYFYRIKAADFTSIRKMVLIK